MFLSHPEQLRYLTPPGAPGVGDAQPSQHSIWSMGWGGPAPCHTWAAGSLHLHHSGFKIWKEKLKHWTLTLWLE